MNSYFLSWLMSIDPKTNWLALYNKDGIPGIETALVRIVRESGFYKP